MNKMQRMAILAGASSLAMAGAIGRQLGAEAKAAEEAHARQTALTPAPAQSPDVPSQAPLARDWRGNMAEMGEAMAGSPLPTRQLKRMAAKALGREMEKAGKIHARIGRLQERKRRRAGIT